MGWVVALGVPSVHQSDGALMAQQWTWGSVSDKLAGGWQEFIRLCNRRMTDLEVLLRTAVSFSASAGTTNVLPKWTGPGVLGDSRLTDTGSGAMTSTAPLRFPNGSAQGVQFRNAANSADLQGLYLDAANDLWLYGAWRIASSGSPWLPSVDDLQDVGSAAKRVRDLYLSGDAMIGGVAYTWPAANASGVLTNNGAGTLSWAASGGGGGGNGGTATLSFGLTGSTSATVTVTGQAWVTGTNAIVCTVVDNARAEDAAIEGLTLTVANQVVGTGFDIIGAPAIGDFVGDVTVAFVGV